MGVTAKMDAMTPVAEPAKMLFSGLRVPVEGSAKKDLIVSKERKRTPSFAMEPCSIS